MKNPIRTLVFHLASVQLFASVSEDNAEQAQPLIENYERSIEALKEAGHDDTQPVGIPNGTEVVNEFDNLLTPAEALAQEKASIEEFIKSIQDRLEAEEKNERLSIALSNATESLHLHEKAAEDLIDAKTEDGKSFLTKLADKLFGRTKKKVVKKEEAPAVITGNADAEATVNTNSETTAEITSTETGSEGNQEEEILEPLRKRAEELGQTVDKNASAEELTELIKMAERHLLENAAHTLDISYSEGTTNEELEKLIEEKQVELSEKKDNKKTGNKANKKK
jgi:hypothetical protein